MAEPVRLERIEDFREAIATIRLSDHARHVLAQANLVALSGLAGGGRNTIINYLVAHYNYYFVISDTTRPPKLRDGVMEQDGVNYYFRTEEGMLEDIRAGEFVEAELIHNQQVSGLSIREIERATEAGKIAIRDFEYRGTQNIAAAKPDAHIIALLPVSYGVWLERLSGREELHPEEFANRLQTAQSVLETMLASPSFRFVINDKIEQAADDLREIVERGVVREDKQRQGRALVQELLVRVRAARAKL
jgi:guanylate kinase